MLRGQIVSLGTFTADGQPLGWKFTAPPDGVYIRLDMTTGEIIWAGWTADELRRVWLWAHRN